MSTTAHANISVDVAPLCMIGPPAARITPGAATPFYTSAWGTATHGAAQPGAIVTFPGDSIGGVQNRRREVRINGRPGWVYDHRLMHITC